MVGIINNSSDSNHLLGKINPDQKILMDMLIQKRNAMKKIANAMQMNHNLRENNDFMSSSPVFGEQEKKERTIKAQEEGIHHESIVKNAKEDLNTIISQISKFPKQDTTIDTGKEGTKWMSQIIGLMTYFASDAESYSPDSFPHINILSQRELTKYVTTFMCQVAKDIDQFVTDLGYPQGQNRYNSSMFLAIFNKVWSKTWLQNVKEVFEAALKKKSAEAPAKIDKQSHAIPPHLLQELLALWIQTTDKELKFTSEDKAESQTKISYNKSGEPIFSKLKHFLTYMKSSNLKLTHDGPDANREYASKLFGNNVLYVYLPKYNKSLIISDETTKTSFMYATYVIDGALPKDILYGQTISTDTIKEKTTYKRIVYTKDDAWWKHRFQDALEK